MEKLQNSDYYYGFEGAVVSQEIIEKFELTYDSRDIVYSYKSSANIFNFVGFIQKNRKTLIVFPKKYQEDVSTIELEDISILKKTLLAQLFLNRTKYMGRQEVFESDFPFANFFHIYDYHKKYGLYKQETQVYKKGYNKKISWKKTIQDSNYVISNNNIIYFPFFYKEKFSENVFISECMIFIFQYCFNTYKVLFNDIVFTIPDTVNYDFFANKNKVIGKLKEIYSTLFKDKEKRLVINIIEFFEQVPEGGNIIMKHYIFQNVWENIVEKYLNNNFVGMDDRSLLFSYRQNTKYVFKKESFLISNTNKKTVIEPDHYCNLDNEQFIFDSKYKLNHDEYLDYKQLSYHFILQKDNLQTTSALFLPTYKDDYQEIHFDLLEHFLESEKKVTIFAIYLNIKESMKQYLQK